MLSCRRKLTLSLYKAHSQLYPLNQILSIFPTECIHVFHKGLTANSDHILERRWESDLCNGEVMCFLSGIDMNRYQYCLRELRLWRQSTQWHNIFGNTVSSAQNNGWHHAVGGLQTLYRCRQLGRQTRKQNFGGETFRRAATLRTVRVNIKTDLGAIKFEYWNRRGWLGTMYNGGPGGSRAELTGSIEYCPIIRSNCTPSPRTELLSRLEARAASTTPLRGAEEKNPSIRS